MKEVRHALPPPAPGQQRHITSLHFGPGGGLKATVQAGLHADEVPGMLVAHVLRQRLLQLEAQGALKGEVVLIPQANPIGLTQRLLYGGAGRFDMATGENFNRGYADLLEASCADFEPQPGWSTAELVSQLRQRLRAAAQGLPALTEAQGLRRTLLGLAVDADIVLDLHADTHSLLHLYCADPLWPQAEPLARLMGTELVLLAETCGGQPFDEACSMLWPRLAQRLAQGSRGWTPAVPQACLAVTVELRGERDVDPRLAQADAEAILAFLAWRGLLGGVHPALPALKRQPRPLAGSLPVVAPHAGVLLMRAALGSVLAKGQAIAELVDPITGNVSVLTSPTDGLLYAHDAPGYRLAGDAIARVAGALPVRLGNLLSP